MAQKAPTDVHGLGENQYKPIQTVITLISSTQALFLVCSETGFRTRASAVHLVFGQEQSAVIKSARYHLPGKKLPAGEQWETRNFSLSCAAEQSGGRRLLIRLNDQRGAQVLIDADLDPLSPALPGVFQAAARADWNGQELLFPKAGSVMLWQVLHGDETPACRFGCADSQSGLRYGFMQTDEITRSLLPGGFHPASLHFQPLSGSVPLSSDKQNHASIRFGRWYAEDQHRALRLIGYQVQHQ